MSLPPLPPGATLDQPDSDNGVLPPLPPGATLDQPENDVQTSGHLFHYKDTTTGADTYSKRAPPAGAKAVDDPNATDGMSWGDKFLSGAGKGLYDTYRGVKQFGAKVGEMEGVVSPHTVQQIQDDVDDSHKRDQDLMNTGAGKFGDIVGTAAPALLMPGTGVLGGMAAGATMGAAQPVVTGESRGQNAVLGALGGGAGGAIGKVFKTLGGFGIPMDRAEAVRKLTEEGIPLSVAQKTAAKGAQTIERSSAMISDAQRDFMAQQQPAFNRAVLRRIGVDDPKVSAATPDVLGPAKKKITDVMDDVAKNGLKVDDGLLTDLGEAEHNASRSVGESDMAPLRLHISDFLNNAAKNNGKLDGLFYQKMRTSLGDLSKDSRYAPFADHMQDALDDALTRSAPDDAARLGVARRQYRALKQIEPAVDSQGNVSVPKLMTSLMNKSNRNQTLYGHGDQSLVDLEKAARHIIPDALGNSGTPERMYGPLTVMEVMHSGEPLKAALKAGAAVYSGAALGRAMRSQGVVGKTLASGVPGLRRAGPIVNRYAPDLGYGAAESKQRDIDNQSAADPIERAAGGKVTDDMLVNRLTRRWQAAKRATDETTKPLLNVPDAAITKALAISGETL